MRTCLRAQIRKIFFLDLRTDSGSNVEHYRRRGRGCGSLVRICGLTRTQNLWIRIISAAYRTKHFYRARPGWGCPDKMPRDKMPQTVECFFFNFLLKLFQFVVICTLYSSKLLKEKKNRIKYYSKVLFKIEHSNTLQKTLMPLLLMESDGMTNCGAFGSKLEWVNIIVVDWSFWNMSATWNKQLMWRDIL